MSSSSCARSTPEPDPELARRLSSAEARTRGRAAFLAHCALCHGRQADGRGERSLGLSRRPADFSSPAWRAGAEPRRLFRVITEGKPGTSMPAWKSLDEGTRWDLVAYLLSVSESGP